MIVQYATIYVIFSCFWMLYDYIVICLVGGACYTSVGGDCYASVDGACYASVGGARISVGGAYYVISYVLYAVS